MITDFRKNKKEAPYRNKFFLMPVAILLVAVSVLLVFSDIKIYQKKKELSLQIENLKKETEDKKKQNENLKEQITRSDDPDYIEKVAREELDLQKQGEKVVTFVMPEQKSQEEKNAKNSALNINVWLSKLSDIWNWLKDIF